MLLDVTRDFSGQASTLPAIDAVLLTHAHRDACEGLARAPRTSQHADTRVAES